MHGNNAIDYWASTYLNNTVGHIKQLIISVLLPSIHHLYENIFGVARTSDCPMQSVMK